MAVRFRIQPVKLALLGLAGLVSGCQSSAPESERGPDKTVAQYVQVESSIPGVRIETNGVYAGNTPLTLRIFGDPLGTFHDFGSPQFIVRAIPRGTNQFPQAKVFRTGKRANGDPIPGLVFFDMSQPNSALQIDTLPER